MKAVIVISVIVLVACLHLQANGAVLRGTSKGCKISVLPEKIRNSCHRFQCANDQYTVFTCDAIAITCPKGLVTDPGKEDLTRKYPNCCARPSCRKP